MLPGGVSVIQCYMLTKKKMTQPVGMYSMRVWSACRPFNWLCHRWWWVSMKPGEIILSVQSITLVERDGAVKSCPILEILFPSISSEWSRRGTTVPRSLRTRTVPFSSKIDELSAICGKAHASMISWKSEAKSLDLFSSWNGCQSYIYVYGLRDLPPQNKLLGKAPHGIRSFWSVHS